MSVVIQRADVAARRAHTPPHDRDIQVLASPFTPRSSKNFAVGITSLEPGKVHEVHTHEAEEVVYILCGSGTGTLCGKPFAIAPGTIVQIDSFDPHGFINEGDTNLDLLWVTSPPGREKNFIPLD